MSTTPPASTTPSPPPAAKPPRRSFKSWLLGSQVGAILLIVLYTLFMLWWSYSEGERAGVLQKFSKRGWVCKTNEGELALYVVGGVAPEIWHFSARDPQVIEQLHAAVGQQVRLGYAEHRGLPTSCFGETDYFVERVEVVGSPPYAVSPAAQAPAGQPTTPTP